MTQKQYMQSGFSVPNSDWIWGVYDAGDQTIYYYSYFAYCGSNSNAGACRNYPFAISKELYDQIPETDVRRNLWLAPTAEEMEETYVDKGDGKTYRCISRTSGLASAGSLFQRGLALRGNGLTSKLYSTSQIYMYMQLKFQAQDLPGVGSFHLFRAGEMAFIEAEAAVDILRGMDVQVDKGRDDDVLAVVNDFFRPRRFGQGRREARYDAVFDMGILIFADRQFRPRRRIEKISFKEHVNVTFFLCLRRYVNG